MLDACFFGDDQFRQGMNDQIRGRCGLLHPSRTWLDSRALSGSAISAMQDIDILVMVALRKSSDLSDLSVFRKLSEFLNEILGQRV